MIKLFDGFNDCLAFGINALLFLELKIMSNQVFVATLTWLENSLNSVIAHCKDRDIKLSLSKVKREISLCLSKALES
jgi:hypothetical protein